MATPSLTSDRENLTMWISALFGILALLGGARYLRRISRVRSQRSGSPPPVDDAAVRRILHDGTITAPDEDDALDLDEIARAEDEFWSESWDEPEDY